MGKILKKKNGVSIKAWNRNAGSIAVQCAKILFIGSAVKPSAKAAQEKLDEKSIVAATRVARYSGQEYKNKRIRRSCAGSGKAW